MTVSDQEQLLTAVLGLIGRLNREAPLDNGAGELCGKLAFLGGARGLALFSVSSEGEAELLGAYGIPPDYIRRYPARERRPVGHLPGDLREAIQRETTVVVVGLTEDPRTVSLRSVALEGRFASSMSIPLVFEHRLVGLLHVFYTAHVRPGRQQRLLATSPLLSSTLARERLRTQTGLQASDVLYSRAQLERHQRHIHAAAERYQRAYSVAVYALDRPDLLQRRYGASLVHQAMMRLLRYVGDEARDADLPGQLDPASGLVLMPDTEQHGAFNQCERVLERFGRHAFKYGDARLQLSCSAGISCFPDNGALSAEASVRSARMALDEALGQRNQRVVAIAARGSAAPVD